MKLLNNIVILGLGSNIGDREFYINKAVNIISERNILSDIKISNIFISPALLKENSPEEWNLEFYNLAIMGYSNLDPQSLLTSLKKIEKETGRITRGKWAPREIDIDILAFNNDVYDYKNLSIPHLDLLNRDFASIPFSEIYPEWKYPRKGEYCGINIIEIVDLKFS